MKYIPEKHLPLRRALSRITLGLRHSRIIDTPVNQPLSVSDFAYTDQGVVRRRKKIVLTAPGCTAATCTMCPIPNEAMYGLRRSFNHDDYVQQFDSAFTDGGIDSYEAVSVYNSGNWFANKEIPSHVRKTIYHRIANSSCDVLIVESLPQFINEAAISEAKEILGDKKLVVGIGLQSADDFVRNVCVNTSCTKEHFERAATLLWDCGFEPRVYLMIKSPFLSETEAVNDCVDSIRYARGLGFSDVSVCPTRVAPNTVVHEMWRLGHYTPPSLWTAVSILREVGDSTGIRVTCLDLDSKDEDTLYPGGCTKCKAKLLQALISFNATQDLTQLQVIKCECVADRQAVDAHLSTVPIEERISLFVRDHEESITSRSLS